MISTYSSTAAGAADTFQRPQGQVLQGQYVAAWRSEKGKLKGLVLASGALEYPIKLPKYLRPMLVRELLPGALIQVWAYPDGDLWRGINILPLPESAAMVVAPQGRFPAPAGDENQVAPVRIQVCGKGKCCRQGSQVIWQQLRAEADSNPNLHHVSVELTGCMKACKQGPNLRIAPGGRTLHGVSPTTALAMLAQQQAGEG
ncbi:hypothetical protein C7271_22385 [filamentous cyanobacterium CCP5]|nr:hypothetical protein C7271_22385 [filamentous cyanobacterium CCP5]